MKTLLQVANVASICGGTGACVWTITRALPDWRHVVLFVNSGKRSPAPSLLQEFGCEVVCDPNGFEPLCEAHQPDVVILHNTGSSRVQLLPDCPTIYYVHSGGAKPLRERCTTYWTVSRWLAGQMNLPTESVVYQPVPVPPLRPGSDRRSPTVTIGRIATPGKAEKWDAHDLLPLYDRLGREFPAVTWEFVGLPESLVTPMETILGDKCVVREAGWGARCWFHSWHAMLYDSDLAESYGRTVAEAQRAGCVPIVSRRGGFIEQVAHERDGLLCSSTEQFAAAVRTVCDRAKRDRLGEAAIDAADARSGQWVWRERFLATIEGKA